MLKIRDRSLQANIKRDVFVVACDTLRSTLKDVGWLTLCHSSNHVFSFFGVQTGTVVEPASSIYKWYLAAMTNDSQDLLSHETVLPVAEVALSAAFLCLVNIGIVVGNFLVLIIVWRTSKLHEPNYFFLCSLSVADLLVGLIYCPLLIVSVAKQCWMFGDFMCYAHAVTICISLNASLMNLCAISVDRYYFITRPLRYTEIVTRKKTIVAIVLVWTHSIFWAVAPLFGWGEYIYEDATDSCKPNWNGHGLLHKSYALGLALFCFLFPVIVMIVAYVKIFKAARKQLRTIQLPGFAGSSPEMAKSHKAAKTVFIIIGMFFLCWSVYTAVSLWKLFASLIDLPARLVRIGLYLAVSNSCVNFYVYAIRDKVFRSGLRRVIVSRRRYNGKANHSNLNRAAKTTPSLAALELDFPSAGSNRTLPYQTAI